jgi:hypothetical protein
VLNPVIVPTFGSVAGASRKVHEGTFPGFINSANRNDFFFCVCVCVCCVFCCSRNGDVLHNGFTLNSDNTPRDLVNTFYRTFQND